MLKTEREEGRQRQTDTTETEKTALHLRLNRRLYTLVALDLTHQ